MEEKQENRIQNETMNQTNSISRILKYIKNLTESQNTNNFPQMTQENPHVTEEIPHRQPATKGRK